MKTHYTLSLVQKYILKLYAVLFSVSVSPEAFELTLQCFAASAHESLLFYQILRIFIFAPGK